MSQLCVSTGCQHCHMTWHQVIWEQNANGIRQYFLCIFAVSTHWTHLWMVTWSVQWLQSLWFSLTSFFSLPACTERTFKAFAAHQLTNHVSRLLERLGENKCHVIVFFPHITHAHTNIFVHTHTYPQCTQIKQTQTHTDIYTYLSIACHDHYRVTTTCPGYCLLLCLRTLLENNCPLGLMKLVIAIVKTNQSKVQTSSQWTVNSDIDLRMTV